MKTLTIKWVVKRKEWFLPLPRLEAEYGQPAGWYTHDTLVMQDYADSLEARGFKVVVQS